MNGFWLGIAGSLSLLACSASPALAADHYARRPCTIPSDLENQSLLRSQFVALSSRADALDLTAGAFNKKCNVDNPEGSPAERDCAAQEKRMRAELEKQARDVKAFNQSLLSAYNTQLLVISNRMTAAAARMKAANRQSEESLAAMNEWTDMSAKARRSAQISAALESVGLVSEAVALDAYRSLEFSRDSIERFEKWYAAYNQVLPESQRATVLARIQVLKSRKDAADLLSLILQLTGATILPERAMDDNQYWEGAGLFVIGTLRLAQTLMNTDPRIKLFVAAAQMALDVSYGWTAVLIAKKQVNQLLDLQEAGLRAIDSLSKSYIDDVNKLKELKSARATLRASACFL